MKLGNYKDISIVDVANLFIGILTIFITILIAVQQWHLSHDENVVIYDIVPYEDCWFDGEKVTKQIAVSIVNNSDCNICITKMRIKESGKEMNYDTEAVLPENLSSKSAETIRLKCTYTLNEKEKMCWI